MGKRKKVVKFIDLFSGAGGMTAGFTLLSKGAFKAIWANDINEYAAKTYNMNFNDHCIKGDIINILNDSNNTIPEADLVVGGPPCQGFSLLNKKRNEDPRKQLWRQFLEVVKRSKAPVFVMENVPQLLSSPEYLEIQSAFKDLGFNIVASVLNSADYGVPQTRNRAFIVGCAFADPAEYFPPKKTNYNPKNGLSPNFDFKRNGYIKNPSPWISVRNAIGGLPEPQGSEITDKPTPLNLHFGRKPTPKSLLRYRTVAKEGMNRFDLQRIAPELTPNCWHKKKSGGTDLFGRLWWDRPAFTIRTEFFKPEKGRYLHPEQHRPITHREAARLQTFPDTFMFFGNKIEIAKQIGNAVPPALAAKIADIVFNIFNG